MNKEILESKIANLLNVNEEDQNQLFLILKLKLAELLKVGEAIRIPQIGVFQLKEKLSQVTRNKDSESGKNLTLVFSPEPTEETSNSLFINLEVDEQIKDDSEFDKDIFQLGIGKSLLTDSDTADEISDNAHYDILTNKVQQLFEDSEKLKNFDLWDDYLKTKETKSILDDENFEESSLDEIVDEDEIDNITDHLVEKDFVGLDENELFDDILKDEDFIHDDRTKNVEEELEITSSRNEISYIEDNEDEIEENKTLEDFEIDDSIDLDEEESKIKIDEGKIDGLKIDLSELDEMDLELKDDDSENEIIEESKFDKIPEVEKNNISEMPTEFNIYNEDSSENISDEPNKENDQVFKSLEDGVKYVHASKKRSPLIYFIIAAVIIVGALAVYYLLLRERPIPFEEVETAAQVNEEQNVTEENNLNEESSSTNEEQIPLQNENVTEQNENVTEQNENVPEQNNETINNNIETTEQKSVETPNNNVEEQVKKIETENKPVNVSTDNEKELEKNIYFNGNNYSIQVSSWKQKNIAEKEVNRLIKKGFPAFIVSVYIAKFQGTWHRVRVGPYNSLKEAKEAQKKI